MQNYGEYMNKFMLLTIAIFSFKSFSNPDQFSYQEIKKVDPVHETINTSYLGDRIYYEADGYNTQCLIIENDLYEKFVGKSGLEVKKGTYCRRPATTSDNCGTMLRKKFDGYQNITRELTVIPWMYGVPNDYSISNQFCIKPIKEGQKKATLRDVLNGYKIEIDLIWTEEFWVDDSKPQKFIEYLGKEGDILRFVFSEKTIKDPMKNRTGGFTGNYYSQDMSSDDRELQISIDLSEDNILAFQGSLIEIIKATSSRVEYRVIRGFRE